MPRHPQSILKANRRYGPPRVKTEPVTAPERAWCEEFAKHGDGRSALLLAWPEYAKEPVKVQGARVKALKASPKIKRELELIRAEATRDAGYGVSDFIADNLAIFRADPNELASVRVGNCRYCNGVGYRYQWSDREYAEAVRDAEQQQAALRKRRGLTEADVQAQAPMPEAQGGFGYEPHQPPHPDCPECGGEGVPRVVAKDTTQLSLDGQLLFAGIKMTKYGPEIQLHDRMKALENVGRCLGAFEDRVRMRVEGGTTNATINFESNDPNVAAQAYKELMGQKG